MINKLQFLISRLRTASYAELTHRVREWVLIQRHKKLVRSARFLLPIPTIDMENVALLTMPSCEFSLPLGKLEDILHGAGVSFHNSDVGAIEQFEARVRNLYFSCIDQVPGDPDIRTVWEPARLQRAAALLHYAHHNPASEYAERYREYAQASIFEWIEKNPFLFGPHYKSAMECGLRIPVFFSALKCLKMDERKNATILSMIYHHAWWIEKRLSLYSSLGNHTVCECVGLVFAGALFREAVEGKRWLYRGIKLLRQELQHQILPDGGPAEQSFNYHRFVLDLYWVVVDFLETNRLCDCSDWKPRLGKGEAFLSAFLDAGGNLPSIGDSDDGYAIAPGVIPKRVLAQTASMQTITFPDSGHTVMRSDNGMHLTFDHGSLGMAPLYNHGHADALSITLSLNGEPLLVDPGTYRYNGVPEYRKYFKGTRAHNTVIIDSLDQAVQETGFIWSKPYTSRLVRRKKSELGVLLEAENDGYTRLKQPVKHQRTILVADSFLLIKDSFIGTNYHDFELNYHLHPDVNAAEHDDWWHLQGKNSGIHLALLGTERFTARRGEETPPLGWYSPVYGIKQPSTVLQVLKRGIPENIIFTTAICLDGIIPPEKLEQIAETL